MNIGVDFDGVLTNISHFFDREGEIYAEQNNIAIKKNGSGHSTLEIFGWSKEDDYKYWDSNFLRYTKFVEPKENVAEVLSVLRKLGHKVIIITARDGCDRNDSIGRERREISENWLKENKIEYDEIIYTGHGNSKVSTILDKQIDVFIDDSIHNLDEIAKYIPVICYDEKYNRRYNNENMKRCKSWNDILKYITNSSKK